MKTSIDPATTPVSQATKAVEPSSHPQKVAKIAVVLFNLGGPASSEEIPQYLYNLFSDPYVLTLPQPFRWALARRLTKKRTPGATESYSHLGGASPLLENTEKQIQALTDHLETIAPQLDIWITPAMRYAEPRARVVTGPLVAWNPDQIVLLPMYPQFSTATTGSSTEEFSVGLHRQGYAGPISVVCCYPDSDGFIEASADLIKEGLTKASRHGPVRLLFSAHGLPQTIIRKGDPYQRHCELTAASIVDRINHPDLDWLVAYQSRVGPQQWITPFTDVEIERAAQEKKALVLYSHAFTCEHSETLVELDIEYRELADEKGLPAYIRVPTVSTHPAFIRDLARIVVDHALPDTKRVSQEKTSSQIKQNRITRVCSLNNWKPCTGLTPGCCPLTDRTLSLLSEETRKPRRRSREH